MDNEIITLGSDSENETIERTGSSATVSVLNVVPLNLVHLDLISHPTPQVRDSIQHSQGNAIATSSATVLREIPSQNMRNTALHVDNLRNISRSISAVNSLWKDQNFQPRQSTSGGATDPVRGRSGTRGSIASRSNRGRRVTQVPNLAVIPEDVHSNANLQLPTIDTYIEAQIRTKGCQSNDEFDGQFKCTYNGCSKIIRNNVFFMYHIWAHIVRMKPYIEQPLTNREIAEEIQRRRNKNHNAVPEPVLKNDFDRLLTCSECLLMQTSPYRVQLHYNRVHKRKHEFQDVVACHTCEISYSAEQFVPHQQEHGEARMPYFCRKCNYRTSYRKAFLHHFVSVHSGTSHLLCPFCAKFFNLPQSERNNPLATAKAYVEHMMHHEETAGKSVAELITLLPKSSSNSREFQERIVVKNVAELPELKSIVDFNLISGCFSQCAECMLILPTRRSQREHFQEEQACQHCSYKSNCKYSIRLHMVLCCSDEANLIRWPVGMTKRFAVTNGNDENKTTYMCNACGSESMNGDEMAKHISCHPTDKNGRMCGVTIKEEAHSSTLETRSEESIRNSIMRKMNQTFGLDRMSDLAIVECDEDDIEKQKLKLFDECRARPTTDMDVLENMLNKTSLESAKNDPGVVKIATKTLSFSTESAEQSFHRLRRAIKSFAVKKYPSSFRVPWRKTNKK